MKALTICTMALLGLSSCGGEDRDRTHWHARYVEDNCKRCPDCCTPNYTAYLEDGGACLEENYDRLLKGWTQQELVTWCSEGAFPPRRTSVPFFLRGTSLDTAPELKK